MKDKKIWTPAIESQLKKLWKTSLSTKKIGEKIGFSKNAVIGKARRLKLNPKADSAKPATTNEVVAKKKVYTKKPKVNKVVEKTVTKKVVEKVVPTTILKSTSKVFKKTDKIIQFGKVSLERLSSSMCIWIEGEPDVYEVHFCGREVKHGKPYCAEHCKEAFIKSTRSSRKNTKNLYTNSDIEDDALGNL